ncbi:hypothetical protein Patl1_06493 [Pistacia atlantica]|uniref:Uncharacterized protein n=1 Tax=Pistacia atlantica TaxID=434234 RepID=A0ACC1BVE0_9ROSI|nr:hypothetical protein Patl1_06493 [Pistacia atlantica]
MRITLTCLSTSSSIPRLLALNMKVHPLILRVKPVWKIFKTEN